VGTSFVEGSITVDVALNTVLLRNKVEVLVTRKIVTLIATVLVSKIVVVAGLVGPKSVKAWMDMVCSGAVGEESEGAMPVKVWHIVDCSSGMITVSEFATVIIIVERVVSSSEYDDKICLTMLVDECGSCKFQ
jgi:hypothetical protein